MGGKVDIGCSTLESTTVLKIWRRLPKSLKYRISLIFQHFSTIENWPELPPVRHIRFTRGSQKGTLNLFPERNMPLNGESHWPKIR